MTEDEEVLRSFCGFYDVQKDDLLSTKRGKLVEIRKQIAEKLLSEGWSYARIGRLLNRHHTTIMHLLGAR